MNRSSKLSSFRTRRKTVLAALVAFMIVFVVLTFSIGFGEWDTGADVKESTTTSALTYEDSGASVTMLSIDRMGDSPRTLRHITVQTGATQPWCRMLLSYFLSQRKGNSTIHNIGWGKKYAHSARPAWILDWVAQQQQQAEVPLQDEDILMFADGGDTLYTGVASEVISREFDKLAARKDTKGNGAHLVAKEPSLPALLFNAEANCYHQQTFSGSWGPKKGKCLSAYRRYHRSLRSRLQESSPQAALPSNVGHIWTCAAGGYAPKFKYLNAGAWIGRVWAVKEVFAVMKKIIEADRSLWCDQSVVGGQLLLQRFSHWTLGIDTENRFFLPVYHLNEQTDFCPLPSINDDDTNKPSRLRLCHSNQTPALLHFNGKSEKIARQLTHRTSWWQAATNKRLDVGSKVKDERVYLGHSEELFGAKCTAVLPP